MSYNEKRKVALVTGAAGFIGYHISSRLLDEGWKILGLDCMSDYYDVSLKERRESILLQNENYISVHESIESPNILLQLFEKELPNVVIHLAAQAGVRFSIENPRSYLEANIIGTFELLEAARAFQHMLLRQPRLLMVQTNTCLTKKQIKLIVKCLSMQQQKSPQKIWLIVITLV